MLLKQPKDKIRYAVVGLGKIAQTAVLPAFQNAQSNSELVALVSGDKDKLKSIGDKYNVEKRYLYSEFEDCLKSGEVDAVYIATPNFFHRNLTETAAKYGVHVLCEKPLAITSSDCHAMIDAAEKHSTALMVAYRLHLESSNLEAIKIAHSKKIGDLKVFNSVLTMQVKDATDIRLEEIEKGGGPLYDIGIYCINAARHLFKAEPIEVMAMASSSKDSRFKKIDEVVSATLRFPDGKVASFVVSFGAYPMSEFDLIGTKGRIKLERAFDYARPMNLKIYEDNKVTTKKYPRRDQFGPELVYFSDCIQNKKKPEASGEEGLADIRIIEALHLSLDLGSPITMDEIHKRSKLVEGHKVSKASSFLPRIFNISNEKH
jgi:predicted dehydrogenase